MADKVKKIKVKKVFTCARCKKVLNKYKKRCDPCQKAVRKAQLKKNNVTWKARVKAKTAKHRPIYKGAITRFFNAHNNLKPSALKKLAIAKKEGTIWQKQKVYQFLTVKPGQKVPVATKKVASKPTAKPAAKPVQKVTQKAPAPKPVAKKPLIQIVKNSDGKKVAKVLKSPVSKPVAVTPPPETPVAVPVA